MKNKKDNEKLFNALGHFVESFSVMELFFDILLSCLLYENPQDKQHKGLIVVCELSFNQKINLFKSLLKRENYDKNKIDNFATRLFKAKEERNILLHSTIGEELNEFGLSRLKITAKKKGMGFQFEVLKLTDVNEKIDIFNNLKKDLKKEFYKKYVPPKMIFL